MNAFALRIAEFLKQFPPFVHLSLDELTEIATAIRVINLEKNKTLFQTNDLLHDSFYVVASGMINLFLIVDAEETVLNRSLPGDIFGLRPFFAKNNYMMTAKSREESVVYAIPIAIFRPYVAKNSEVLNFLLESFAANTANPEENRGSFVPDSRTFSDQQSQYQYFQTLAYNKTPLKSVSYAIIRDVAQLMSDNLMDSVIIADHDFPIGIVTDLELRSKVATGRVPISVTVDKVMNSTVITVAENVSLAEAQLLLLKHNVTHLCVTADGSEKSEIKGIISQRDLIVAQASNPGILIKEIKRSRNAEELKNVRNRLTELLQRSITKNIPLVHINSIAGEINLAIVKRSVELAILDLGSPPARYAWLCIGSQGRKEQLLLTDQDSILIFEDVAPEKYRDVKDYFLKLAAKAVGTLEQVGYPRCPNRHMASNILYCKSLSEWTKQYVNWMNNPTSDKEISSIFFDVEIAAGEQKLEEAITNAIFTNVQKQVSFFDYLGNDALRKPAPLSFFKKFNLEEEGPHKDQFDIKTRALMPIVDSARLLTLNQNIRGINNTYMRFKQLAIAEPKYAEIYLNCAEAFLVLSKFSTQEGLRYDNSGQYLNMSDLSKNDRERLKNALAPMKDLEEVIKNKFRLTQFS